MRVDLVKQSRRKRRARQTADAELHFLHVGRNGQAMIVEPWLLVTMICASVGALAFAGRRGLEAWGLRQLEPLARETEALLRCWAVIDRLPAEALPQSLRCTLGGIMYERLKRARRVHPDHPFLRDQQLQIARFIGREPTRDPRKVAGPAPDPAAALDELRLMLAQSEAEGLLCDAERVRAESNVTRALTVMEISQHRHTALQAEYLRRIPQAVAHLRSALQAARALGPENREQRDIARRLQWLESGGLLAAS
jgi:hypothetical protein